MFNPLRHLKKIPTSFTVPIPQDAINKVLPFAIRDVDEVDALRIEIGDGHFDTIVDARKAVLLTEARVEATVRFVPEDMHISVDEQWMVLRQVGTTRVKGRNIVGTIAATAAEAIVVSLLKLEPAREFLQGQPSVTIEKDRYHIDFSDMVPPSVVTEELPPWTRLGRITELRCTPGRFEIVPSVGLPR